MRASSKCPIVVSSFGVEPPSPSSSDPTTNAFVDPTTIVDPPPFTSDDSSIRCMLDTIMTVQLAHGQLLMDMLTELQALHAELANFRQSPPPPPFDVES